MKASEFIRLEKEEKEKYLSSYSFLLFDDPVIESAVWKDLGITGFATISRLIHNVRDVWVIKKTHAYCYKRVRLGDRICIGLRYGNRSTEVELKFGNDNMWRVNGVYR